MDRIWKMSLLIVFVALSDQFTKGIIQSNMAWGESYPVVEGFFNITHVRNTGAAWGIGAGLSGLMRGVFLLGLPLAACLWLVCLIWTSRRTDLLACISYSLILAGAIGNLIDRFFLGYVVDFLDFYVGTWHFPAFNVADSSISIAAFLLIVSSLKGKRTTS